MTADVALHATNKWEESIRDAGCGVEQVPEERALR